jgi:hypothetical protein
MPFSYEPGGIVARTRDPSDAAPINHSTIYVVSRTLSQGYPHHSQRLKQIVPALRDPAKDLHRIIVRLANHGGVAPRPQIALAEEERARVLADPRPDRASTWEARKDHGQRSVGHAYLVCNYRQSRACRRSIRDGPGRPEGFLVSHVGPVCTPLFGCLATCKLTRPGVFCPSGSVVPGRRLASAHRGTSARPPQ